MLQIFIPKGRVDNWVYLACPCDFVFSKKILGDIYDTNKKRHIKISPILDLYKQNPKKLNDLAYIDHLQARILINNDFLDPDSGVKFFRYNNLNKNITKSYYNELKYIVNKMMLDWLKETYGKNNYKFKKIYNYFNNHEANLNIIALKRP